MDYRKGLSPARRRVESQAAIRKALEEGKKTFGELLKQTGRSRSTLAFHLKEMHKAGDVDRKIDPKDYRVTYYSLTSKGKRELQRQEDIEILNSGVILPTVETYAAIQEALAREHILENEDAKNLIKCITYSVYSKKPLKDTHKNHIIGVLESATKSLLRELIFPRGRMINQFKKIPKIPSLTLVVRFNGHKMEEFARKIEVEANNEPLSKPPDLKDYLKKRKRED